MGRSKPIHPTRFGVGGGLDRQRTGRSRARRRLLADDGEQGEVLGRVALTLPTPDDDGSNNNNNNNRPVLPFAQPATRDESLQDSDGDIEDEPQHDCGIRRPPSTKGTSNNTKRDEFHDDEDSDDLFFAEMEHAPPILPPGPSAGTRTEPTQNLRRRKRRQGAIFEDDDSLTNDGPIPFNPKRRRRHEQEARKRVQFFLRKRMAVRRVTRKMKIGMRRTTTKTVTT